MTEGYNLSDLFYAIHDGDYGKALKIARLMNENDLGKLFNTYVELAELIVKVLDEKADIVLGQGDF